jgi:hypothetical protein
MWAPGSGSARFLKKAGLLQVLLEGQTLIQPWMRSHGGSPPGGADSLQTRTGSPHTQKEGYLLSHGWGLCRPEGYLGRRAAWPLPPG